MNRVDECFDMFWDAYPNKKSKGVARKAFEKAMKNANPDELTKDIILALDAQKRYRNEAASAGEFVPNWKYPGVWLNAEAWLDEIKSHADIKERAKLNTCQKEGCDLDVHGPRFKHCSYHLPTDDSVVLLQREYLRKNNLTMTKGETVQSYAQRCREHLAAINPLLARKLNA